MILLVDNYDSFSFNLVQLIGSNIDDEIKVIRNDELTVEEIIGLKPEVIVISPGPGKPRDAGIIEKLITNVAGKIPILGVCLGHQAIAESFGGRVVYAKVLMHGKQSLIEIDNKQTIFDGLPQNIEVARYHSLAVEESSLPNCLEVIARDKEGEVMAIRHKEYPVFGLQFHPESVMTPDGAAMIKNFYNYAKS